MTASCTWQIMGLPTVLEAYETHPLSEGRYDHQGTHGAWPRYNSLGKSRELFFASASGTEAMSDRATITPGILPFALRASCRCSNRSWRFSPPRVRAAASIHWIDRSALTLPDTTPHAPWRPSNYRF